MIPKSGNRFSEKIMRKDQARTGGSSVSSKAWIEK
jgi:hypothetical protein